VCCCLCCRDTVDGRSCERTATTAGFTVISVLRLTRESTQERIIPVNTRTGNRFEDDDVFIVHALHKYCTGTVLGHGVVIASCVMRPRTRTLAYSTVLYSTVLYCTVMYSTVQYSTVLQYSCTSSDYDLLLQLRW
jgi:hypothetical protein